MILIIGITIVIGFGILWALYTIEKKAYEHIEEEHDNDSN